MDTGYGLNHPDLPDTADGVTGTDTSAGIAFVDGNGHGTHVSGTIGAIGGNGVGVVGGQSFLSSFGLIHFNSLFCVTSYLNIICVFQLRLFFGRFAVYFCQL